MTKYQAEVWWISANVYNHWIGVGDMSMTLSIQETADKLGVSSYTLRYYEKEEIIPTIERNASGHRVYKDEDLEWIQFVTCLKSTGMPISEIKRFVQLYQLGDASIADRKKLLIAHKNRLLARMSKMKEYLEKINWKIEHYEGMERQIVNQ